MNRIERYMVRKPRNKSLEEIKDDLWDKFPKACTIKVKHNKARSWANIMILTILPEKKYCHRMIVR